MKTRYARWRDQYGSTLTRPVVPGEPGEYTDRTGRRWWLVRVTEDTYACQADAGLALDREEGAADGKPYPQACEARPQG